MPKASILATTALSGLIGASLLVVSGCQTPAPSKAAAPAKPAKVVRTGEVSEALVAAQCNTCHGEDGKGAKSVPSLAGLEAEEIFETMKAYASGADKATIMDRHAKGYSDAELHAVAKYYSEQ